MSVVTIRKAVMMDAEELTEIMKTTFNAEAKKWLPDQEDVVDYNIKPPGYSSIEMTKYMMEELEFYKIVYDKAIVGGIIATISGRSFGRIDRIFVHPNYQGKGIGSRAIMLIEEEFPNVTAWDLETSSRQVNNHYFYEKMGYKITFKTEDEYCYIKRKPSFAGKENVVEDKNISSVQYENCNMEKTECYSVNLQDSVFSNSNLMNTHMSNSNLSHSSFRNINLRQSHYADLNLSHSKFQFVTLGGVRFIQTVLGEDKKPISFESCDLQGTAINNSNLQNLVIQDCDITGMKIDNVPVEELFKAYYQVHKK
ncbi:GNAT family N-acetyltransferase [Sutcliffiella deserti]|uniref:GNAT family N-acetyltransferase n=1 Tax=Sutcliffiella deserti TaxID=2875501 RepID=UPI001CBF0E3C|nr:GNAT family N-acetyltransferase [Sutcliffiella deserti]